MNKEEHVKHEDIYDDLVDTAISGRIKKVAYAGDHVEYKVGQTPRAYVLRTDLQNVPKTQDFLPDSIDCPVCAKKENKVVNITNPQPTKWVERCPRCRTIINFFTVQPLQHVFTTINSPIINIISGYGLGKTTANMKTVMDVVYNIDGAQILVAGSSDTALNTGKDELKKFICEPRPNSADLVVMNSTLWTFKNGSSIRWMSANTGDVTKIRSWNFNTAVLLEASSNTFFKNGSESFFNELKTRMRSPTGNIEQLDSKGEMVMITDFEGGQGKLAYDTVLNKIIMESNPSPTKIMEEVFNKSSAIILSENVANGDKLVENFKAKYSSINAASKIVTILASTRDNKVLPESFMRDRFGGMPPAYVARMRDCDLTRNEMQIFPTALDYRVRGVTPIEIKTADLIVQGFDPGGTDESGILYAAFWKKDEMTGRPRIELFNAHITGGGANRTGNSFKALSEKFAQMEVQFGLSHLDPSTGEVLQGWYNPRTGKDQEIVRIADLQLWDNRGNRQEYEGQDMQTEYNRWADIGYEFMKAMKGPGTIANGIELAQSYMDADVLHWNEALEDLYESFIRYWYEEKNGELKPMEKGRFTHLMDCLRYIVQYIKAYQDGEEGEVISVKRAKSVANTQMPMNMLGHSTLSTQPRPQPFKKPNTNSAFKNRPNRFK